MPLSGSNWPAGGAWRCGRGGGVGAVEEDEEGKGGIETEEGSGGSVDDAAEVVEAGGGSVRSESWE